MNENIFEKPSLQVRKIILYQTMAMKQLINFSLWLKNKSCFTCFQIQRRKKRINKAMVRELSCIPHWNEFLGKRFARQMKNKPLRQSSWKIIRQTSLISTLLSYNFERITITRTKSFTCTTPFIKVNAVAIETMSLYKVIDIFFYFRW